MKRLCLSLLLLGGVVLSSCAPSATASLQSPLNTIPLRQGQTWLVEGMYQSQVVKLGVNLNPLVQSGGAPYSTIGHQDYQALVNASFERRAVRQPMVGFDPARSMIRFVWAWPIVRGPGRGEAATALFDCRIRQYNATDTQMSGTLHLRGWALLPSGEFAQDTWTASGQFVDAGAWEEVGSCTATLGS